MVDNDFVRGRIKPLALGDIKGADVNPRPLDVKQVKEKAYPQV